MEAFATPIEQITTSNDALSSIYFEDRIIHQMMDVDVDNGYELIRLVNSHFYLSLPTTGGSVNNKMLDSRLEVLTSESLEGMLSKAVKLLFGAKVRHITGLRIHFGFDGNSMRLIYQPVIMKWEKFDSMTLDDLYNVEEEKNAQGVPVYYCYNNGSFAEISDVAATTYKNNYKGVIRIKHNFNTNEQHTDSTPYDVESIIVTFQTIFSLMIREKSKNLFLNNSVRKLKENPSDNVRHSILMSASEIVLDLNSNCQFSNRSHLCPPCGNKVGFDIAE